MSRQFYPVPKLDHDTCVYLAGIIDGEGCFYISRKRGPTYYYQPQFKIVLVDEPTIAWMADKLQRTYTHQKAQSGRNHKDTYSLRISDRVGVTAFIPQILPYMITKRAVAIHVLEFCQLRESYEKIDKAQEAKMYSNNRNLNKVGVML